MRSTFIALSLASAASLQLSGTIRPSTALPQVIGHRGLKSTYPENTLISFQAALDAGADGIEGDLHRTADGVIVMMHDDTLDRTTNCTGMVENTTLLQLRSCNAAYTAVFGAKYGFQPIPLFDEVIALISQPQYDSFIIMDLKESLLLGQQIAPILSKYNATTRAIASCWTFPQLADAVTYLPNSARQILNESLPGDPLADPSLWESWMGPPYGVRGFSLLYTNWPKNTTFVAQAHTRLLSVVAWISNDVMDARELAAAGVDGIITDYADVYVNLFNGIEAAVTAAIMNSPNLTSS